MAGIESRIGSTNRLSCRLAAETSTLSGSPCASTSRWYLLPALPRSVGFGPVNAPPFRPRRRGREGPRARTPAGHRDGRRDVDPDRRLVAGALAHHHRAAPGTPANAGELRVRRPQAPDPRHRPPPDGPAATRTPRPALHRPAGRRLLPRLRPPPSPDPLPGPHRQIGRASCRERV